MEKIAGSATRFSHRKTPSSERFLGVLSNSAAESHSNSFELNEQDIFNTAVVSSAPLALSRNQNTENQRRNQKRFGILAALPDSDVRPIFNHKASSSASLSSSSSSSSSARIPIPAIPRRLQSDRMLLHRQSAPVDVPIGVTKQRVARFDDVIDDDDEGIGLRLAPHEMVEAKHSPMVACSVLEGAGRTLKGRDLRQVRNAVWRKTGFLD